MKAAEPREFWIEFNTIDRIWTGCPTTEDAKKYKFTHVIEHSAYQHLRDENEVLKNKLGKCVQSLKVLANADETMKLRYEPTWYEDLASGTLKELDAISDFILPDEKGEL